MPAEELPADVGDIGRILRERARTLARPVAHDGVASTALLMLRAGERRLGIVLDRVRAVLPPATTARLPAGSHTLAGLRAVAGELVPVADIGRLVGAPPEGPDAARHVVVLDDPAAPLGILADAVEGIVDVPDDELRPLGDDVALLRAMTTDGLAVLDVDALLADPRLSITAEPAAQPTDRETRRRP